MAIENFSIPKCFSEFYYDPKEGILVYSHADEAFHSRGIPSEIMDAEWFKESIKKLELKGEQEKYYILNINLIGMNTESASPKINRDAFSNMFSKTVAIAINFGPYETMVIRVKNQLCDKPKELTERIDDASEPSKLQR